VTVDPDIAIFEVAINAAKRSSIRKFKTGAAIYDSRWRLLSIGWSHVPEGTLDRTPWSKHAELHAWERAASFQDSAFIIVIATLTAKGNITCGAPCSACAMMLAATPINKIYYTQRFNNA
jgi:deoxycytidylate deaminase